MGSAYGSGTISCEGYRQNGMEATLVRNTHPDVCSKVNNLAICSMSIQEGLLLYQRKQLHPIPAHEVAKDLQLLTL